MRSIKSVYKIGMGPSSSHTMGPNNAAKHFENLYGDQCDRYECDLFGSLSETGRGHLTDIAIKRKLSPVQINWKKTELPRHPNAMTIHGFKGKKLIASQTYYSVGGGEIIIENAPENNQDPRDFYQENNFEEIKDHCLKNKITLLEYIKKHEDKSFWKHLNQVYDFMMDSIGRGLEQDGVLPGKIELKRKAKKVYNAKIPGESQYSRHERFLSAYALAVNEENASGGVVVTAPTCGGSGVVPAVLCHMQKYKKISKKRIIESLAIAGLIGNLYRTNATISGAEGGCQAEVGVATSMAAGAIAYMYEPKNIAVIEEAASIAMEHQLGLTCDPIMGYVQIPCIERNAVAASRAMHAFRLSRITSDDSILGLDAIVAIMFQTGKDLKREYRETSLGGLATLYLEKEKRKLIYKK